ncbi:MAG: DUF58 domain-containing protein [Butyricicoccaceae bacterium]
MGRAGIFMRSEHCGSIQIRVEDAAVSDWFGLWRSGTLRCAGDALVVLPELFAVRTVLSESAEAAAEGERWSMTRAGSDASETFAIREYHPGDPVRQIHWKLSQKTDTMMLRELGLPVTEEVLLMLETSFMDQLSADAMDLTMEAMLSVSHALAVEGIAHGIVWKNRRLEEPELVTVCTEREFDEAARLLLSASSAIDDEGIGASFRKWYPERTCAHTAVFSPHPATDAVSLLGGGRVTLCLPEGFEASPAGGVFTVGVSREMPYIEL